MGDEEMLEDIENCDKRLSEWEQDFTASVRKKLDEGWPISQAQKDALERLHDKLCG